MLEKVITKHFFSKNVAVVGLGSGLSDVNIGLRLRYEIKREFAPYIGVEWTKSYGNTADYIAAEGGDSRELQWVLGLRAWF